MADAPLCTHDTYIRAFSLPFHSFLENPSNFPQKIPKKLIPEAIDKTPESPNSFILDQLFILIGNSFE